jgi:Protein of unknown function (DUF3108)
VQDHRYRLKWRETDPGTDRAHDYPVKPRSGFPFKRIALAVALSLLAHSLLLWQWPKLEAPANEEPLPRLQAKLEPLARLAKKPVARRHKAQPFIPPQPITQADVASIPAIADSAASAVVAEPVATTGTNDTSLPATTPVDETISPPLLPKHAQLHFAVQYGSSTFKVGEVSHFLDNTNGRYTLRAETQTTGLVGIFKSYRLSQTSTGTVTAQGLRPDSYGEVKTDSSGTQTSSATFDWNALKVRFENGNEQPLTERAQDILSLPYQLSQLPLNLQSFPIVLSKGKNINQYYITVGEEQTISTALGELRTVVLSKVHGANEDGLIIWLALEYRLLPVKMLYLDKSGEVSANMLITDIRVSDE